MIQLFSQEQITGLRRLALPASVNVSQIHFNRRERILRHGSSDEIYNLNSSKLRRKKCDFKISTFKSGCFKNLTHASSNSIPYFVNQIQALTRSLFHWTLKYGISSNLHSIRENNFSLHEPTVVSRTQRANDIGCHWWQTWCNASWGTEFKVRIFKMPDIDESTQKQHRACLADGVTAQLLQVWQHSYYHL